LFVELEPTDEISRVFPYPFTLSYVVTLAAHQLSSDFHVGNPSKDATLAFQAVLHTYYAANASSVKIKSLKGLQYVNKVKGGVEETETRDIVDVSTFTDSIYRDAPDDIVATWEGGGVELKKRHLKDVVVWNPAQEAGSKIGDMEDGGW
jgi:glucose-6-phosphate 1-epimerase